MIRRRESERHVVILLVFVRIFSTPLSRLEHAGLATEGRGFVQRALGRQASLSRDLAARESCTATANNGIRGFW